MSFNIRDSYWFVVPIFLLIWGALGLAFKNLAFVWLKRWADRTSSDFDDLVVRSADYPLFIMVGVSGLSIAYEWLIPERVVAQLTPFLPLLLKSLSILAIVLFVDFLIIGFIRVRADKVDILRAGQGLLRGLTHLIIFGLGALIVLDNIGISITPLVASLGIGSLAVALALQPTLENLFAGVQIVADKPVMVGHFVKLESGEEGYVERIGWRSTWIRQLANNMVVIPNSDLVKSRVLNYYYPSKDLAVLVEVGVHYTSDLAKVERVTVEVGEEIMKTVPGAVRDFKPFIRFHTMNESSVDFTVILRAQEFVDSYLIKHEFLKALLARYEAEGITIPFPIVALNTTQEKAVFSHGVPVNGR